MEPFEPFKNRDTAWAMALLVASEPRLIRTLCGGWLAAGEESLSGQAMVWGRSGVSHFSTLVDQGVVADIEYGDMEYGDMMETHVYRKAVLAQLQGECWSVGHVWIRNTKKSAVVELRASPVSRDRGFATVRCTEGRWIVNWQVAPLPREVHQQIAVEFHLAAVQALHLKGLSFGYSEIADRVGVDLQVYIAAVKGAKPAPMRHVLAWIDAWNESAGVPQITLAWHLQVCR